MWGWDACVARPIRRGGSGVDVGMGRLRRPGRRGKRSRDQDEGDASIPTALACCSLPSKRTGRPEAPGISRTPLQILCPATRFYSYISSYPQTGSTGHSDSVLLSPAGTVRKRFNPKRAPQAIPTPYVKVINAVQLESFKPKRAPQAIPTSLIYYVAFDKNVFQSQTG